MAFLDAGHTHELLLALGEHLERLDAATELVVIGGAALLAVGLTTRATLDIDVVAFRSGGSLVDPRPLPEALVAARDNVARDFHLPAGWLNAGPANLLDFGLPAGFVERLERRDYGQALVVHFASRFDQIHFKLYAMADQTAAKHETDLAALEPTPDELVAAARWTRTHDPSEGFLEQLVATLSYLGVEDVDLGA